MQVKPTILYSFAEETVRDTSNDCGTFCESCGMDDLDVDESIEDGNHLTCCDCGR